MDRELIGPQRQAANLTPNPEHSSTGNNSLNTLFGGTNGWQSGPQIGNQDNNYLTAAGTQNRLTQSYTRTITTPVASSTAASAPSNITPISNQPSSTATPNPPHNPYFQFPACSSGTPHFHGGTHDIQDGRSWLFPNQGNHLHGNGPPYPGDGSGN